MNAVLGVGVEPGTPPEHLLGMVDALGLVEDVVAVATIETRADEFAVTTLAAGRTLRSYPAAVLDTVEAPNPSAVVRRLTGTGSVAEAAAILAARELDGGVLVVGKQRGRGVTVAVAHAPRRGSDGDARDARG